MARFPHFGIPSLDYLFRPAVARKEPCSGARGEPGPDEGAGWCEDGKIEAPNLCIMGPDGTGKSVVALHLASRYLGDFANAVKDGRQQPEDCPRVIYASTDLSYEKAHSTWQAFKLDAPEVRERPFSPRVSGLGLELRLEKYAPPGARSEAGEDFARYLDGEIKSREKDPSGPKFQRLFVWNGAANNGSGTGFAEVAFLDLASETAGDDYGLLNRTLTALPDRPRKNKTCMRDGFPHLLIVDAVEGLEALVGEFDAHGQRRSRRSRIAQLVRSAADNCSLIFVLEEPQEGVRLSEEFVVDYVLRLRRSKVWDYEQLTAQVEKARGEAHVRGQHPLVIRAGEGSTTGDQPNWDDPNVQHAYVHVFHSIDALYRDIMETRRLHSADGKGDAEHFSGFGISYLDDMLGKQGLTGKVTALLGDDATHKSRLGRSFLAQCFSADDPQQHGVAVLLTTQLLDAPGLLEKMQSHLPGSRHLERIKSTLHPANRENRKDIPLICRRLEIRTVSSATLFHIIEQAITQARKVLWQQHLRDAEVPPLDRWNGDPKSSHIRLVIDDWSTIKAIYPDVAQDPLFLPFLIHYLERQQVTALIIDTQSGGPERIIREEADRELRALVSHHLYTWHVSFFGEHRIAISAIPPFADTLPACVRELCPSRDAEAKEEGLFVNPHFELYTGLEHGNPVRIPLRVRLYMETPAATIYAQEVEALFRQIFRPAGNDPVIFSEDVQGYERLREFCYLQRRCRTRLDYTVVLQLDEHWFPSPDAEEIQRHCSYLTTKTSNHHEDPFSLFQPVLQEERDLSTPAQGGRPAETGTPPQSWRRCDFFRPVGYEFPALTNSEERPPHFMDRVPYLWDFGFLLCREAAWREAGKELLPTDTSWTVEQVWSFLPKAWGRPDREWVAGGSTPHPTGEISWRHFLEAATVVAGRQSQRGEHERPRAFDLDMQAMESFSCLVLEVWASEINQPKVFAESRESKVKSGLLELLKDHEEALYKTLLLLGEVIAPEHLTLEGLEFQPRPPDQAAVAARHWYSSASQASTAWDPLDARVAVRLPGRYSVRGDWFVAVASGSRSTRLGFQAIDLLCSRRANITRLQLGLGLPVRDVLESDGRMLELWTALYTLDKRGHRRHLRYGELLDLGGPIGAFADGHRRYSPVERGEFHWLWRSTLRDYHRHARLWGRWLRHALAHWPLWRAQDPRKYENGFHVYDHFQDVKSRLGSVTEFKTECAYLRSALQSAQAK